MGARFLRGRCRASRKPGAGVAAGRQSHRSRQRSFWWCLSVSSLLYRSGGVPKAKPFARRSELQFAGKLFGEISAFGSPASGELRVVKRADVISMLERIREHILFQRMERPEDLVTLRHLSIVDMNLARKYTAEKKVGQARALLRERLETLDRIEHQSPDILVLARGRFAANSVFAEIADIEGKTEESIAYMKKAVAHGEEYLHCRPDPVVIADVAYCRRSLATFLSRQGNEEGARSEILANLRMLDDVPKDVSSPIITIWRTLVRLDLHEFTACTSSAPTSQAHKAEPFSRLASSEADVLDSESWAELVARCLSSGTSPVVPPDRHLCDFMDGLSEPIALQRRLGRSDDAKRSAGRMHAFARLMVSRYPGHSVAHVAVCQAMRQMAKNASRTKDRAAVERRHAARHRRGPPSLVARSPGFAPPPKRLISKNVSTCSWHPSQNPENRNTFPRRLAKLADITPAQTLRLDLSTRQTLSARALISISV